MKATFDMFRIIFVLLGLQTSWIRPLLPPTLAFAPSRSASPYFHLRQMIHLASSSSGDNGDTDSFLFDMNELNKRMEQQMTQYYDLFTETNNSDDHVRPESVYIIVFNPDSGEQQGVHTIEYPKGSGDNVILAFESGEECIEFAQMLKDMQFYNPIPQMANLGELEVFCQGMGVPVKIVPKGRSLRPPADNVEELDMNPNLERDKQRLSQAFMESTKESETDDRSEEGDAWQ